MGKKVVVEGDKVEGTDKHNLSGPGVNATTSAVQDYKGVGSFDYVGSMTDALSGFVKIDGRPVALKSSRSSLNPGETAPPAGKHSGPAVKNPTPSLSTPVTATVPSLKIDDPVGEGKPSASAGSVFVKVAGTAVLLDDDKIDTCDGFSVPMNSKVTAEKQDFVSCSE